MISSSIRRCADVCSQLLLLCCHLQVTIYDDMHMGDHVAVVGNLALSHTADEAKVGDTARLQLQLQHHHATQPSAQRAAVGVSACSANISFNTAAFAKAEPEGPQTDKCRCSRADVGRETLAPVMGRTTQLIYGACGDCLTMLSSSLMR